MLTFVTLSMLFNSHNLIVSSNQDQRYKTSAAENMLSLYDRKFKKVYYMYLFGFDIELDLVKTLLTFFSFI